MLNYGEGGITFNDTENMDEYERTFVLKKLMEMKKEENNMKQKAIQEARAKQKI